MDIKLDQITQLRQKRELAARRLEEWKKRNEQHMRGWDPVQVLRKWREKRWSSSTHQ